jgi:uncharacterized membrane protein YheB (UPF0754 family)
MSGYERTSSFKGKIKRRMTFFFHPVHGKMLGGRSNVMVFIILPIIGALIGWITNYIAIRLLFRPLEPVRLWPFPITFQGLIPKRKGQIADTVGQIVAERLFSVEELTAQLDMPKLQAEAAKTAGEAVGRWCDQKMGLLPGSLRDYCSNYFRDAVAAELATQFPKMTETFFLRMREQVDVGNIVADKLNALSLDDMEEVVLTVASRELKQIEWLGGVLGFMIGLVQALIAYFLA